MGLLKIYQYFLLFLKFVKKFVNYLTIFLYS